MSNIVDSRVRNTPDTCGRRVIGHQIVIHASGRRLRRLQEKQARREANKEFRRNEKKSGR